MRPSSLVPSLVVALMLAGCATEHPVLVCVPGAVLGAAGPAQPVLLCVPQGPGGGAK